MGKGGKGYYKGQRSGSLFELSKDLILIGKVGILADNELGRERLLWEKGNGILTTAVLVDWLLNLITIWFCRVRCSCFITPSRDANRWRKKCGIWRMAMAGIKPNKLVFPFFTNFFSVPGVSPENVFLRFLQHASLRWRLD